MNTIECVFFLVLIGLEIHGDLPLFDISMRTRPRRQWRSLMVRTGFVFVCNDISVCVYVNAIVSGRVVDGREIMVKFAKYGPDAERM